MPIVNNGPYGATVGSDGVLSPEQRPPGTNDPRIPTGGLQGQLISRTSGAGFDYQNPNKRFSTKPVSGNGGQWHKIASRNVVAANANTELTLLITRINTGIIESGILSVATDGRGSQNVFAIKWGYNGNIDEANFVLAVSPTTGANTTSYELYARAVTSWDSYIIEVVSEKDNSTPNIVNTGWIFYPDAVGLGTNLATILPSDWRQVVSQLPNNAITGMGLAGQIPASDGAGLMTFQNPNKRFGIQSRYVNATVGYWFKIADLTHVTTSGAQGFSLYVANSNNIDNNSETQSGIIHVAVSFAPNILKGYCVWDYNVGFDKENFILIAKRDGGTTVAEFWVKIPVAWNNLIFDVLSETRSYGEDTPFPISSWNFYSTRTSAIEPTPGYTQYISKLPSNYIPIPPTGMTNGSLKLVNGVITWVSDNIIE